jgi:hypothetical protein
VDRPAHDVCDDEVAGVEDKREDARKTDIWHGAGWRVRRAPSDLVFNSIAVSICATAWASASDLHLWSWRRE